MSLVLSRKVGQELVIDGKVVIRIQKVNGTRVSLAIDAPKNVTVDRREIQQKKDAAA